MDKVLMKNLMGLGNSEKLVLFEGAVVRDCQGAPRIWVSKTAAELRERGFAVNRKVVEKLHNFVNGHAIITLL